MADAEPEHNSDELSVHSAVTRMLTHNDWRLLDAAELTQRVLALLNNKPESLAEAPSAVDTAPGTARPWRRRASQTIGNRLRYDPIEGAAVHEYAKALYTAYTNKIDEEQQRRAYYELFRYVFRAASRWAADLRRDEREEIAYQVLAELYFRLVASQEEGKPGGVRVAGAFLAIALQQMKNTVRQWRMTARHWATITTSEGESAAEPPAIDDLVSTNWMYAPEVYAEQSELRVQVVRLFASALQRYPRARIQLHVVWLHQVESLDYPIIADRLGMTVENSRVLYSRGIKRLRNESGFRALAEEERLTIAHQPLRDFDRHPDNQREHSK